MKQLVLLILAQCCYAAKIAIFTFPTSSSQMVFNNRLAVALADGGHEVVIVRPDVNPAARATVAHHPRVREIRGRLLPDETLFSNFSRLEHEILFSSPPIATWIELGQVNKKMLMDICENQLYDDDYLAALEKENFDLAFHHHIDLCQVGIHHSLRIPRLLWTMSMAPTRYGFVRAGLPAMTSIVPGLSVDSMHMSFYERLKNTVAEVGLEIVMARFQSELTEMLRQKYGSDFPHVKELAKTGRAMFMNADDVIDFPVPVTNKIHFVGGLGMGGKTAKKLEEPFLSFASSSSPLVVVSFGSVAVSSEMPESWKKALVDMFERNPHVSFVWKFEEDLPVPDNVLRAAWIPQHDLLALPQTVAFVSHGGMNSLQEAIATATPAVYVPLFADQYRNARLAEWRGFGIPVQKSDMSGDTLHNALTAVLTNPKYMKNMRELQKLHSEKPMTPEQVALYWTNFHLQYDIDLDIPQLNVFQLYCVDVWAILITAGLVMLWVFSKLPSLYYWSCCTMAYKEKEKVN